MKKKETMEELEKRDAAGYARIPSQASDFGEWQSEQLSLDEDDAEEQILQPPPIVGGMQMEVALEKAAEIRYGLEGRHHSDSTELLAEAIGPINGSSTSKYADTKTLASRNESLGFAHRTLLNLEYVEQARMTGDEHVHVITQRVVSLLGLIVFPWEQGFDASIKTKRVDMLYQDGWPEWITLQGSTETLGDLVYHLRNAVAHRRLRFGSDSRDPKNVEIEFADAKNNVVYWQTKIGADALLEFCRKFITLVDDTIG